MQWQSCAALTAVLQPARLKRIPFRPFAGSVRCLLWCLRGQERRARRKAASGTGWDRGHRVLEQRRGKHLAGLPRRSQSGSPVPGPEIMQEGTGTGRGGSEAARAPPGHPDTSVTVRTVVMGWPTQKNQEMSVLEGMRKLGPSGPADGHENWAALQRTVWGFLKK